VGVWAKSFSITKESAGTCLESAVLVNIGPSMPAHLDGEKMKIFASGCNSVFRSIVGQIPILSQDSPNGHAISDVYEFLQGNGCAFPVSFGSKWSFLGAAAQ